MDMDISLGTEDFLEIVRRGLKEKFYGLLAKDQGVSSVEYDETAGKVTILVKDGMIAEEQK